MAELRIDGLSKRYGAQTVLSDITLAFSSGAYVALLGPSGSGKSTLLRAIAGLTEIDGGSITLAGRVLAGDRTNVPPEARELGMVFQSYAVWPHRNVRDNVAYPLVLRRDRNALAKADGALDRVGLNGFGDRMPATLSGGQQQRVALARALLMEPKALLLDEPLANLDPHLRADLCDQFRAINKERGLTFVHVTHDREEALGLATELVVLKDGRVVQHGAPDELFHRPRDRFIAEFVAEGVAVGNAIVPRHALRVDPNGPWPATIEGIAYAGAFWNVTVALESGGRARVRCESAPKVGDRVRLSSSVIWDF